MKNNYSEMNVDMEQILFSKNYEDLTASELNEIKDFVSSKEEFNLMKNTLMNVKTSFGTEDEIEPVDSAKDNLMKMFEQKHGKVIPMNKPRPFYLNPVFQIGVAAMLVLGFIFFYPKGDNESITAMNENKEEAPKEIEKEKDAEASPEEEVIEETETESIEEAVVNQPSVTTSTEFRNDGLLADEKPMAAKEVTSKNISGETEKKESYKLSDNNKDGKDLAELESTVKRSSSNDDKKVKEDLIGDDDNVATVTTTGASNGAILAGFADAEVDAVTFSSSSRKKADSEEKSGKATHTNSAGGYYMQPGTPAADLKLGVSLKDEPALSEFLFTAL